MDQRLQLACWWTKQGVRRWQKPSEGEGYLMASTGQEVRKDCARVSRAAEQGLWGRHKHAEWQRPSLHQAGCSLRGYSLTPAQPAGAWPRPLPAQQPSPRPVTVFPPGACGPALLWSPGSWTPAAVVRLAPGRLGGGRAWAVGRREGGCLSLSPLGPPEAGGSSCKVRGRHGRSSG